MQPAIPICETGIVEICSRGLSSSANVLNIALLGCRVPLPCEPQQTESAERREIRLAFLPHAALLVCRADPVSHGSPDSITLRIGGGDDRGVCTFRYPTPAV